MFTKARATAPSVLFLDELDALVDKRSGTSGTGVEARLLSTLLNEMDGIGTLANIYQSAERNTKPYKQGNSAEQLMVNHDESIYRVSVSPDFDGWLTLFVILQAALYALEDGGMSVCRVEHKHFMAALSIVEPSLTTEQLEKFKRIQR